MTPAPDHELSDHWFDHALHWWTDAPWPDKLALFALLGLALIAIYLWRRLPPRTGP